MMFVTTVRRHVRRHLELEDIFWLINIDDTIFCRQRLAANLDETCDLLTKHFALFVATYFLNSFVVPSSTGCLVLSNLISSFNSHIS